MDNSLKKNNLEYIKKARAKIEEGWTQKCFARTKNGVSCSAIDPSACYWCAEGALIFSVRGQMVKYTQLSLIMENRLGRRNLSTWNDLEIMTKEDVLHGFDFVIQALESELA